MMNKPLSSTRIVNIMLVTVTTLLLCGCQLTGQQTINENQNKIQTTKQPMPLYLSQYYLDLKQLNSDQLKQEKQLQQAIKQNADNNKKTNNTAPEYRLLLINSLLNTPAQYNKVMAAFKKQDLTKKSTELTPEDLAFVMLLQDQVNKQLTINDKLLCKEDKNSEMQLQLEAQKKYTQELELRSQKLQQQIIQLKEIERSINDHGTSL